MNFVRKFPAACIMVSVTLLTTSLFLIYQFREKPLRIGFNGVEHTRFDLGDIFYGQTVARDFTLHNDSHDVLILQGKTECGCTKMTLDGTDVEPGSTVDVKLTYASFLRETTGRIESRFSISTKVQFLRGREGETPVLNGVLSLFVRPTIVLDPAKVEILVPEDQETEFCRAIDIENVGDYPIDLHSDMSAASDLTLTIVPERLTLQPGHKCSMTVVSSSPIKYRPLAYVADLSLSGSLHHDKSRIPVRFVVPIRILPTRLAVAKPGSLFFANAELDEAKVVTIVPATGRKELAIRSIVKPDSITVDKVGDVAFTIRLDRNDFEAGVISERVIFKGVIDAQSVVIEVPVLGLKK